ncbi:hypothetical protein [Luteolibacter marinus]|uniref:hypothetical protein n=1 Tax=Luteolibacter marinus TaxID=2776705 RepID=UPI0018670E86|nr:hypothetical protein [Luteolibacter marinus]
MHCLKSSEIKKWLTGQGMHHQPLAAGVPIAGEYEMPADPSSRLALADSLARLLTKDGTKLIEVIPPNGACDARDQQKLDAYRCQHQEERPIGLAPGHLFKSRDRDEFPRMLSMLLGFGPAWGLYVYSAPSRTTLLVNSRIDIWSIKRGLRNELGRWLPASRAA